MKLDVFRTEQKIEEKYYFFMKGVKLAISLEKEITIVTVIENNTILLKDGRDKITVNVKEYSDKIDKEDHVTVPEPEPTGDKKEFTKDVLDKVPAMNANIESFKKLSTAELAEIADVFRSPFAISVEMNKCQFLNTSRVVRWDNSSPIQTNFLENFTFINLWTTNEYVHRTRSMFAFDISGKAEQTDYAVEFDVFQSNSSSNLKKQINMYYFTSLVVPKVVISLSSADITIDPEYEAKMKQIIETGTRKHLFDLFETYGFSIPTEIVLGGCITTEDIKSLDMEKDFRSYSSRLSNAVATEFGQIGASGKTKNDTITNNTSEIQLRNKKVVGGANFGEDMSRWAESLNDVNHCRIIKRCNFKPLYSLFKDKELAQRCKEIIERVPTPQMFSVERDHDMTKDKGHAPLTITIENKTIFDLEYVGLNTKHGKIVEEYPYPKIIRSGHTESFMVSSKVGIPKGPRGDIFFRAIYNLDLYKYKFYYKCPITSGSQVKGDFSTTDPFVEADIIEETMKGNKIPSILKFIVKEKLLSESGNGLQVNSIKHISNNYSVVN
eukprot:gene9375-11517_t